MDQQLKKAKQTIRAFLAAHYSDERLAWLLAHARARALSYHSCCCLIGVATADHALRPHLQTDAIHPCNPESSHLFAARTLSFAAVAEDGFEALGYVATVDAPGGEAWKRQDEIRRRRVVPIILAEIRRRERVRAASAEKEEVCHQA